MIVIEEEGVQRFANIEGLISIRFRSGQLKAKKHMIQAAIDKAYKRARKFYGL